MNGKRKLLSNSFALLANRLTQSISTFALFIFIARILGPYTLGQYTLAFNYFFLFMTIASQGFKTLFTRELSRNPERTPIYLVSGSLLQLIIAVISYLIMVAILLISPYTTETSFFCCVLGLMILPFSLSNITEAIFQAHERMYLIAISTVPVYIIRLLVMIWALNLNYGLLFICLSMVLSEALIFFIQWLLITNFVNYKWNIDWKFIGQNLKSVRTFIAIEGVAVLKSRMPVFILSIFSNEAVIGLFGSIVQLMQPFEIVANSLVISVFPGLTKAVQLGKEKQRHFVEIVIEALLCIALPILIGILFIGSDILIFVYGNPDFTLATSALNIIALTLIVSSFARPLSYLLVANGLERVNLVEVSATSLMGGVIGLIIIPKYQLVGAAIAANSMHFTALGIYIYAVVKRLFPLRLLHLSIRPCIIGGCMLVTFILLQKISLSIFLTLIIASLAYILQSTIVYTHAFGGPSVLWSQIMKRNSQK